MASTKVKGIVIGGTNYKEKDKIINIYSLENGKMTLSMRGVRGEKAKLKYAKDVFCFGEFIIEQTKAGNIVSGFDMIDNFYNISKDIDAYYEGCAILNIVSKVGVEPNPAMFVEVIKSLRELCYGSFKKYYVIDKFLISVCKAMGYNFINEKCSGCGAILSARYLNLEVGEMVCPKCKTALSIAVSPACYSAIKILDSTDYENLSTINLGGMGEVQAYNLLSKNFEWRTGYSLLKIDN